MSVEADRRGVSLFHITRRSPDFYNDTKTLNIYRKSRLPPYNTAKQYGKPFSA